MELKIIDSTFSICHAEDFSLVDFNNEFIFTAHTDEEYSIVCPEHCVPENAFDIDNGWRAFRITGVLDFSLIGILSDISAILAKNKIGIFAVSTYNTDYILTKSESFQNAIDVLKSSGYTVSD